MLVRNNVTRFEGILPTKSQQDRVVENRHHVIGVKMFRVPPHDGEQAHIRYLGSHSCVLPSLKASLLYGKIAELNNIAVQVKQNLLSS